MAINRVFFTTFWFEGLKSQATFTEALVLSIKLITILTMFRDQNLKQILLSQHKKQIRFYGEIIITIDYYWNKRAINDFEQL